MRLLLLTLLEDPENSSSYGMLQEGCLNTRNWLGPAMAGKWFVCVSHSHDSEACSEFGNVRTVKLFQVGLCNRVSVGITRRKVHAGVKGWICFLRNRCVCVHVCVCQCVCVRVPVCVCARARMEIRGHGVFLQVLAIFFFDICLDFVKQTRLAGHGAFGVCLFQPVLGS